GDLRCRPGPSRAADPRSVAGAERLPARRDGGGAGRHRGRLRLAVAARRERELHHHRSGDELPRDGTGGVAGRRDAGAPRRPHHPRLGRGGDGARQGEADRALPLHAAGAAAGSREREVLAQWRGAAMASTSSRRSSRTSDWICTRVLAGRGPEPKNCSRTSRKVATCDASRTYQLSFTTSAKVQPPLSRAIWRFLKTCSAWARTSPLPTRFPWASKATWPAM